MRAAVRFTSGPRRTVTSSGRWPVTCATASCTSRGTRTDSSETSGGVVLLVGLGVPVARRCVTPVGTGAGFAADCELASTTGALAVPRAPSGAGDAREGRVACVLEAVTTGLVDRSIAGRASFTAATGVAGRDDGGGVGDGATGSDACGDVVVVRRWVTGGADAVAGAAENGGVIDGGAVRGEGAVRDGVDGSSMRGMVTPAARVSRADTASSPGTSIVLGAVAPCRVGAADVEVDEVSVTLVLRAGAGVTSGEGFASVRGAGVALARTGDDGDCGAAGADGVPETGLGAAGRDAGAGSVALRRARA